MGFNLPNGLLFHDNWNAFNKWHEQNSIIDFFIAILGIVVTLLFSFMPSITTLIINNLIFVSVVLLVLILACFYKFFKWKLYNFKRTEVSIDSLLIFDYDDELLTINVADNIIIPSEDILSLSLTLHFDDDIIKDLEKNKKYEIIFFKPTNLEIDYQENEHIISEIIGKDKYSKEYRIQFNYRHNTGDTHIFNLESDLDTTGYLKIFFRIIPNEDIKNKGLFKDEPLFSKEIYTTDIIIKNHE